MEFEHEFDVSAPVGRVYAYLLNMDSVAACMPGAELSEHVDADTFRGKVRIKVGAITVGYDGTATITERDPGRRTATLAFDARERGGGGSARATARMSVEPTEAGSRVKLTTDVAVAGRVATFGRGILEDVSRRLVEQMADCIRSNLESGDAPVEAAPGAPISVLRLLAAVLRDRGRRLFGRPPVAR
jgi:uncharacterized protein